MEFSGWCFALVIIILTPLSLIWNCALMFLGVTLAFQRSIVTLLSASENGLTPAGMLLADWLVCESNALTYSRAKQRIFVTMQ
jgi:hypothetical protein